MRALMALICGVLISISACWAWALGTRKSTT
jgi:hypothetical protein